MKPGWRDKVLRYYKEFKSLHWLDARDKFDHHCKDKWGEVLYHIYEGITQKCPFTETDRMCSYCWDYYHNMVDTLTEPDEAEDEYFQGLQKKHLDYMMKLTNKGVDNE